MTLTFNQLLSSEGLPLNSDIRVLVGRRKANVEDATVMTRVNGQDQVVSSASFEVASYSNQALRLHANLSESVKLGTAYVSGALTLQGWFMPKGNAVDNALTASTLLYLTEQSGDDNSVTAQMDAQGRIKVGVKVDGVVVAEATSQDALMKANQWAFVNVVINDQNQIELWVNGKRAQWDRSSSICT